MQDMWEKWVFLASLAASTCLMRTSVGNILAVTTDDKRLRSTATYLDRGLVGDLIRAMDVHIGTPDEVTLTLAALHTLTTLTGSVILALAVAHQRLKLAEGDPPTVQLTSSYAPPDGLPVLT